MKEESFDWIGKRARRTLAGLLIMVSAGSFGIQEIRSYLSNRDSRIYANIEVRSSDAEIRTPTKKVQPEFETYVNVKHGDTLSKIAERYGVPMDKIIYLNGIQNPDLIYEKQKLRILIGGK